MVGTNADGGPGPLGRTITGAVAILVGAIGLVGLFWMSDSASPLAEHAMITLGLAGAALLSALFQVLVIFGGWTLWRVARRGRRAQRP